jgi:ectoine hydroxylase-related dioxygenase (phytanoyl-CoA dioxygenase family)
MAETATQAGISKQAEEQPSILENPAREDYTFALEDPAWPVFLETQGYVVLQQALATQEVEHARSLLWNEIESAGDISRYDMKTWQTFNQHGRVFRSRSGITAALAQTEGAWYVRGRPKVKQAFARIWDTQDLLVSMDGVIVWRPWWASDDGTWVPICESIHLDQNPFHKPAKESVQGMVPLLPVTGDVGGLMVCPGTHLEPAKVRFRRKYPEMAQRGHFCPLGRRDKLWKKTMLLLADPGDLVLWDSRTVHGGLVGKGPTNHTNQDEKKQKTDEKKSACPPSLARMAVPVCMTPERFASEEALTNRLAGFVHGTSFNHTPHEACLSTGTRSGYQPPVLSETQLVLLGGQNTTRTQATLKALMDSPASPAE